MTLLPADLVIGLCLAAFLVGWTFGAKRPPEPRP